MIIPAFLFLLIAAVLVITLITLLLRRLTNPPSEPASEGGPSRTERSSLLNERRDRYRQERGRILNMVDSGQISASEAARLLESLERDTTTMACPFCGEDIRVEALKCPHCGQYLVEEDLRPRRLTRSRNKMLAGVCGGIADYSGMDASLIRILAVVLTLSSALLPALIIYLIAALVMPPPDESQ